MEITKEMVEEFNEWLRISRCIFRLKFTHNFGTANDTIKLAFYKQKTERK